MLSFIKPWKTLKSTLVFDNPWYKLRRDEVELPNGQVLNDYFVSVRPEVVLTFAVTDAEEVLFVRQYKHGAGRILLELPGGVMDAHETDPTEAARRELLEETGYLADDITPLTTVFDNPTKDTNRLHFFLARRAQWTAAQHLDPTENIEVVKVPLADVEALVLNGSIGVSGSVALCLLALGHLRQEAAG
ncbi:NUDIX hydrolase [Hymenobacter sp. M29]|uniref:GDP-mannose pyrophosphatase n=1 Tax=Hymenobacter mellowenesis TaxID=3063995 RepID=A0ABT9ADX1_9BACT|nr:NUDIX hydrolase [Hymenobacter sp. M29]MDO7847355.1 NUDIX hydrolase [Hymenobacter sp. M29]